MHPISNFILSSRLNASRSLFETAGDVLLIPARILLGGKEIIVLNDGSVHAMNLIEPLASFPRLKTVIKIIAVVTLPFSLIGAFIKLPCFKDKNYREFCIQKLPQDSSRIVEIFQHVLLTRFYVSEGRGSGELIFHPPSLATLGLYECSCGNTGEFHRLNSPRRNDLEEAIIQRLTKIHLDKNEPIQLLSLGSGGLMSDFITLEKLVVLNR